MLAVSTGSDRVTPSPFAHSPWGKFRDVIAYTGFSLSHIEKSAASGALLSHGTGKGRRFHRDEVDQWMRAGAKSAVLMEVGAR